MDRMVTEAPGHDVLLYDGECTFCKAVALRLCRSLPLGTVELRSFREPGALAGFPGLGPDQCEKALQLVRADGRVFAGLDGAVEALRHGRLGRLARWYRVPGVKQVADATYRLVARVRYRLAGRACGSRACRG